MHWTVQLDGGPRRVNHAAVAVGEKVFTFGGYCNGEDSLRWRPMDVHVLNTTNFRWTPLPIYNYVDHTNIPYQRYGHTAVSYGQNVYVWGGRNDTVACNVLFCFNTKTHRWHAPKVSGHIPGARDGHSACVIGHNMYIFGGFEEEAERYIQTVHMLNFKTMEWSFMETKGAPPTHRDFHSATAVGNRMYIFGGRGSRLGPHYVQQEIYCSDIMYLDMDTNRWHRPETTGMQPLGRRSHSAFYYDGYIFIFGGYNGLVNSHYNELFRFCPKHNKWDLVFPHGTPPCPRRRQACVIVGDRMILFGGTSPMTPVYHGDDLRELLDHNDMYLLDFAPSLRTLCLLTVIRNKLEQIWLPDILRWEIKSMVTPNVISRPLNSTG